MEGLDILVIDALRRKPHSTHFSVGEALTEIEKIQPKRAFLTHLCHMEEHGALSRGLPDSVSVAYDGLRLKI
jgi:phosphoribosyl 1,2-cyclic phosphate phosphodiesterase